MNMTDALKWAVARLREPSTYAGLAGVLAAFHISDASSWAHNIAAACMGIAGCVAMFMAEKNI